MSDPPRHESDPVTTLESLVRELRSMNTAEMADRSGTPSGGAGRGGRTLIQPMLATLGEVPAGPGWAFEVKFDGVRAIGYRTRDGLALYSRNDRDITATYPEIAGLPLGGPADNGLVVDGELVALDERGRPDFELLQERMQLRGPSARVVASVPVRYVLFDLLEQDGQSLLALPYRLRRERLTELRLDAHPAVTVPAAFTDTAGGVILAAMAEQGLEGVVAKRLDSPYLPGRRSRSWIKTAVRRTHEVVVAGWFPGSGSRREGLGSLALGAHDDDGALVYVGDVGTGFTDAARARLLAQLRPLERATPPFDVDRVPSRAWPARKAGRGRVRWVEPRLVGEIEYRVFTRDRSFRHPSWRGLRPDRAPDEVRMPPQPPSR
jgi:bifunctional non-homologous end joining protein LigD